MHRLARLLCIPLCLLISLFAPSAQAATLTVTSNADSGTGSLRAAIATAAIGDTINFALNGTITLGSTLPEISSNLTIVGNGPTNTVIDGAGLYEPFYISNASAIVSLSGLMIQHGHAGSGGGASNNGTLTVTNCVFSNNVSTNGFGAGGGGIYNSGTLSVSNCTFVNNDGSYAFFGGGGGIYNDRTLTVADSTFSGNVTSDGFGGGIFNNGVLTVINSTFSGNSSFAGGGIAEQGGALSVVNSTFSGNSVSRAGGAIEIASGTVIVTDSTFSGNFAATSSVGGGIYFVAGTLALNNSILANNVNGDCYSTSLVIATYSLIKDGSCGVTNGVNGNVTGVDANLGPLADNGGPTQTMLPGAGSPVIDAVPIASCSASADQRGVARPQGSQCDMGAVEVVVPQTLTVGVTGNGSVSAGASPAPQDGGISNCTNAGVANCSATYGTGQSVVLTAVVPSGNNVTWGGACAAAGNAATATVTMNAAKNCTATFALNIATTALTSPSSTSTYGQPVTFIATMAITAPSVNILPTGTVTFLDGGTPIGTGTLTYVGVATFTTNGLSAGSHSITAQYGGDGNFLASAPQPVSNTLTFEVSQKSTRVSLVVAPDHIALGQSTTITATVAGDPPTGTVSFKDNGNALPCSPVTLAPGTTNSTAVCTDKPTAIGSHTIVATYSGDGNYAGATSSAEVVTVNAGASAAPTLDRWAMAMLTGLLCMSVALQLRGTNRHV